MPLSGPPWGVVHVVSSVDIGGQETVILSLCELANRHQFSPRVLCFNGGGELAPQFAASGVALDVLSAPPRARGLTRLRAVHDHFRLHRPTIVHTHNPPVHLYGAIAAKWAGVQIVVHTKHGRNDALTQRERFLERMAGRLTDMVVTVSEDAAGVAHESEGVPLEKIEVIRNGIDLFRYPEKQEVPNGWRVVHVARLTAVKDQSTLVRAARLLADHHPHFQLDIVGDGEERGALESLVAKLRLEAHVHFRGITDNVQRFLARADLFALSSISEGVSISILEAMASGLPVVATDVGGNREVVMHGKTGLLVPPGDPAALARAIAGLLEDPRRAGAMGRAGRQRAELAFSARRTAMRYEELYARLLKAHSANLEVE